MNENINGLDREYIFFKISDFEADSDEWSRDAYAVTNRRPRKRHGFRTPYEVYHSQTLHLL